MLHIKSFEFSPIRENTYLIYNELNECLVIDPGMYFDEEKDELAEYILRQGLKPVRLLNTHCHLDHVFGNKFIAEQYGLILEIHLNEQVLLDYAPTAGLMYNLPFDNYQGEVRYLQEGERIRIGEDELQIILAPGHSPGSLCFYCDKQGFLIGGDVLFQRSIGRTDLPGGNFDTLARSIRTQLYTLPDATIVYPGHGPATSIGDEKKFNPFVGNEPR